jgi:hypothetical protein
MADSVAWFVADLARELTGALVNQYAVEVTGVDRPGAAAIRCVNLRAYLEPRVGARLALIGEAPSAHGARFSGIAFTAERSLNPTQRTSAPGLAPDGFTEHSATILSRALAESGIEPASVVLWNAVPFHPARSDDGLRNRRPRPSSSRLATTGWCGSSRSCGPARSRQLGSPRHRCCRLGRGCCAIRPMAGGRS